MTAYYNENDPKAAAWLRELIKAGHIAPGIVDERDIRDVRADDLAEYAQCHFFAGIGGWSYALRLAGWPDERPVWTGSCPCQPFSVAGMGKGIADERHLWPTFAALIRSGRPPIVFGEQVASAAGRQWLAGVFADLEGMAYIRAAADLCAPGVGAPHIRQRLYWMAVAESGGGFGRLLHRPGEGVEAHRGGAPSQFEGSGNACRLDNSTNSGAGGAVSAEPSGDGPKDGLSRTPSATGGMGDAKRGGECWRDQRGFGEGREQVAQQKDRAHSANQSGDRCEDAISGMADHECSRQQGRLRGGADEKRKSFDGHAGRDGAVGNFWSDFDIVNCLDGKARRISSKPALFPLAHGVSGRVGLLRGAGNAIVPQLAAQFIQAATEAIILWTQKP